MEDTIAAIGTPQGVGGIAIVRMSGPRAVPIGDRIFVGGRKVSQMASHTLCYGRAVDGGDALDEVLVSVMKAPRSYTREDVVEINCHGGLVAAQRVLKSALSQGARLAGPGEFTQRAFLNGRMDLAQAEAVIDLVRARTPAGAAAALAQLDGRLSDRIAGIKDGLLGCLKLLEVSLDFAEDDVPLVTAEEAARMLSEGLAEVNALRASYDRGRLLREGGTVVIVGKPNVGKSSLLNRLLQEERAIVSATPGTTRDSVEEWIELGGVACKLVDTAGLGEGGDEIEAAGVRRTRKRVSEADVVVAVFDRSQALDERDAAVCRELRGRRVVVVVNKCDLAGVARTERLGDWLGDAPAVEVSAKCGTGMGRLEEVLAEATAASAGASEGVIITRARHRECLDRAAGALERAVEGASGGVSEEFLADDVREALAALGELCGVGIGEDVLGLIFEEFCIGK